MDKKLETKLTSLEELGKRIEVYKESIADKETVLDGLKRVSSKLGGLPTAKNYVDQAVPLLEEEIKLEKMQLKALKQDMK